MLKETPNKGSYKKLNNEPKYSSKSQSKSSIPITPTKRTINATPNPNNNHIPYSKIIIINTDLLKDKDSSKANVNLSSPLKSPLSSNPVADLLYNKNDNYEDLQSKNVKLRALVIQASTTIRDLSKKCQDIEINCNIEKTTILNELDKISKNYQMYAESHKQRLQMQNDFEHLHQQYAQNNKVMEAYQMSIVELLKDNMKTFVNVANVLDSHISLSNPQEFLYEMKMGLRDNLNKYQMMIDSVIFGNFYDEYANFLEVINDVEMQEKEINSIKKKKPTMMRKKEYVGFNDNKNNENDTGNRNSKEGYSLIRNNQRDESKGNLQGYISSQPYKFKQRIKSKANKSYDVSSKSKDEFGFE